ncbi:MAG: BREX-1 system adenine-specific DNA-methyltransferase PglX, partial [Bdellovibrionaceae bacterium]|nr:BREX-1 system adenine-specific DNA-methyltransferase PglX [Pseudobdellovibrionaceae bacterium]
MFYNRGPRFFHDCYDFKYIPSDILGYAYEHSIAYELNIDKKTKKFKLEKKKLYKNGVHYTPAYICSELSNTSVERAIKNLGKSAIDLVCFDIACGSGSFLTSLYDTIYKTQAKSSTSRLVEGSGLKVLSLKDRKFILESCIFGIDIDYSAVQITKLCLYLKFFENFPDADLDKKCSLIPNLEENIVFGDSLLDTSQNYIHPKTSLPIGSENGKVFKYLKTKSIDVIVGNPPYIKVQDLKKIDNMQVEHYKLVYSKTLSKGSIEFAIGFIERAMSLLNPKGVLGYIIPNKIFRNKQGENLRNFITDPKNSCNLYQFIDFNSCQLFDASIYTCLLYLEREKPLKKFKCCQIYDLKDPAATLSEIKKTNKIYPSKYFEVDYLNNSELSNQPWSLLVGPKRDLFKRLKANFKSLGEVAVDKKIFQGIPTGSDKIFLLKKVREKNDNIWLVYSEALEITIKYEQNEFGRSKLKSSIFEIESKYLKPVYRGSSDLKPFFKSTSNSYILYPYDDEGNLITDKEFLSSKAFAYLNTIENKKGIKNTKNVTLLQGLEEREDGKFKGKKFYQYSRPQNLELWSKSKIMIPYLVERFNAHLDEDGHMFVNVSTGGYCILAPENKIDRIHLLGILNSKVFDFMVKCFSGDFRGGWIECNKHYIGEAPVPLPSKKAISNKEIDKIQTCLNELYESSGAYYSEEQTSSNLKQLNIFYRNSEWLDLWSKSIYGLSD